MAMLRIIDRLYGDKQLVWRADDKESKEKALQEFKDRIKQGWLAFIPKGDNPKQGKQIRDFDENAETIVMTPPVAGG